MNVITTVADMQAERRRMSGSVGLVPTMGYLHEGHLSLVRRARDECDHVVVSIFVNPSQFGPNEDFQRYPRDTRRDLSLLEDVFSPLSREVGAGSGARAAAFIPTVEEVYPPGFDDWVEVTGPLSERLEGATRPGHFRGVATVVNRLFRIIQPHRAYFGQKDAQQLRVIRRMVCDLELPVEIVPMPTVREPDGLALSSRNVYLSAEERSAALVLPRALALARRIVMTEGVRDAEAVRRAIRDLLARGVGLSSSSTSGHKPTTGRLRSTESSTTTQPDAPLPAFEPDYVSVSDEQTLEELDTIDRPALILLAARVGATRLIDNTIVVPKGVPVPDHLGGLIERGSSILSP